MSGKEVRFARVSFRPDRSGSPGSLSKTNNLVCAGTPVGFNSVPALHLSIFNFLGSFVPSFYSGEMIVADPGGNLLSINPNNGKTNWDMNLKRDLSAGTASGFGKIIVSDTNGFVIAIYSVTKETLWEKNMGGEVLSNGVISASLVLLKNSSK